MPESHSPDIFIQEIPGGTPPIEGVDTSTAGFLGIAERGPALPTLLTSFREYREIFGNYVREGMNDRYLAYAVEGFFQNGGRRCYVQRVIGTHATAAGTTIAAAFTISALSPGLWGNGIAIEITWASPDPRFKLTVSYWGPGKSHSADPSLREEYESLSIDEASVDFYLKKIQGTSRLVTIQQAIAGGRPPDAAAIWLTGGSDGQAYAEIDFQTALDLFEKLKDITILCCPEENGFPRITGQLVDQCERLKDRFAILQAPLPVNDFMAHRPPRDSRYGAYYLPWLRIRHPGTGAETLIPPGGHIAGIYARTDSERGVHQAPTNEVLRGLLTDPLDPARGLAVLVTKTQQDGLNLRGVNVLRYFPGRGILLWGARTMASDPEWKFVNVRRLVMFIESSLRNGLQWVVFEPNAEPLWTRARSAAGNFLAGLWKNGMLQGQKPEQAFFVTCDRTTMTQADLDQGKLILMVGIAAVRPAEFIVIRIGLWAGGSEVIDS